MKKSICNKKETMNDSEKERLRTKELKKKKERNHECK